MTQSIKAKFMCQKAQTKPESKLPVHENLWGQKLAL